jgi:hypothetical protein
MRLMEAGVAAELHVYHGAPDGDGLVPACRRRRPVPDARVIARPSRGRRHSGLFALVREAL